jgi:hypothetical protein
MASGYIKIHPGGRYPWGTTPPYGILKIKNEAYLTFQFHCSPEPENARIKKKKKIFFKKM